MPEVRLGAGDNQKNINLGAVEIQEVYLGTVLVWQNNLGPTFTGVTWDGTTLTGIPASADLFEGEQSSTNTAIGVNAQVTAGVRTMSIVVSTISDPDNADASTDDYIVGYRLQRPDDTWVAGDPDSTGNNSKGAPIADYGATLPGISAGLTYTAGTDTWAGVVGDETVASTTITALLRNTTSDGTLVTTNSHTFRDRGTWVLYIIDSRGGEQILNVPNVHLQYPRPTFTIGGQGRNAADTADVGGAVTITNSTAVTSGDATTPTNTAITNATIGGPNTITLSATGAATAGPVFSREWECVSGCTGCPADLTTATINVDIPQSPAGTATPCVVQLTTTGRRWANDGGAALQSVRRVAFRSGVSCTPSVNVDTSSFSYVADSTPAVCSGAASPTTWSVTSSGTGCGAFSYTSGTSYTPPSPACVGVSTLQSCTVSVSGTTTGTISGIGVSGSRTFTASYPAAASNCDVTMLCTGDFSARDTRCGGAAFNVAINCSSNNCAGSVAIAPCNAATVNVDNMNSDNYSGGGLTNSSACSGPGGTATLNVSYRAIVATWGVTCPTFAAGTPQAAVAAGCTFAQTNSVTITAMALTLNSSGACLAGNPPLVCLSGTCTAANGTGCAAGSIACERVAACT